MKNIIIKFQALLLLSLFAFAANAYSQQGTHQSDTAIAGRIKKDIYMLASDSLQGRETGTNGELMARDYIVSRYKAMGIAPAFKDASYLQAFTFKGAPECGDSNFLTINNKAFKLKKDYYPLAYSANASITGELVKEGYGIVVSKKNYNDYKNSGDVKGKIAVLETGIPKQYATDTAFTKYLDLQRKIDTAVAKGAIGIVFINSDKSVEDPSVFMDSHTVAASVPVIFAQQMAYKLIMDGTKKIATIRVNLVKKTKTGYNVAAFIDNKAANTIVIGGHYDHLGWGNEYSNYHGKTQMIHHGADDNASGASAVIEMARYFKNSAKKKNNYLFINFSGEEEGALGSSWFTKSDAINMATVNYMVNFDMVGRYDSSKNGLNVIGTGTSPLWDTLISITTHHNLKNQEKSLGSGRLRPDVVLHERCAYHFLIYRLSFGLSQTVGTWHIK